MTVTTFLNTFSRGNQAYSLVSQQARTPPLDPEGGKGWCRTAVRGAQLAREGWGWPSPSREAALPFCSPGHPPPLATLGGWDGWMLLPDWDYGDPSCSLKTSGVRVVWGLVFLIVAYSTAAPGLSSPAFQLHIRYCPRTVITWEADRQSAVTPAAVVYDVTAHSFPLRQSVCLWLFHGRSWIVSAHVEVSEMRAALAGEGTDRSSFQCWAKSSVTRLSVAAGSLAALLGTAWGIAVLVLWRGTLQRKGPVSWSGPGSAASRCSSGPISASEGPSPEKN